MWAIPTLLGFAAPLLAYAGDALATLKKHLSLMEDNPEGARDITVPNPLEWLTMPGWLPTLTRILLIGGTLLLLATLGGMICARLFGDMTGVDGQTAEREQRDRETDDDEYHDVYE